MLGHLSNAYMFIHIPHFPMKSGLVVMNVDY